MIAAPILTVVLCLFGLVPFPATVIILTGSALDWLLNWAFLQSEKK